MIRLLLALHPGKWRARYGEEYRWLLESSPLTTAAILDVLRNAARLHAGAHPMLLRVLAAAVLSCAGEVLAVQAGLTSNILWPPTTIWRALALAAVITPWTPAVITGAQLRRAWRSSATGSAHAD